MHVHNDGHGKFHEVTLDAGVGGSTNDWNSCAAFIHYDNDGNGRFSDVSAASGLQVKNPATGVPAAKTLGVAPVDMDGDGWIDLVLANDTVPNLVFINQHNGTFKEISKIQKSQKYEQPAQLFWNAGDRSGGCFVSVPPEKAGNDLFQPIVGRGSAFGDIDGDGDLDVVLTQVGRPPLLLRNDQKLNHHWLRLKLVGAKSNRSAIGAWITVRVNGQTLSRQVMPTRSYLSQSELPITIGLGDATKLDSVEILWPSGTRQKVESVQPGQTTVVTEGR